MGTAFTKIHDFLHNFIHKYSIRKIMLIASIIMFATGAIFTACGTFSTEYTIQQVQFRNTTYYQKAIDYGDTYQPLGVSLVPDEPIEHSIAAYVITPTGKPTGYKFPTIIWCHGMVASYEMQVHYATEMACAGFKVIAISLDGHGDSGGLWTIGLSNILTFYAAVEYAASLPDVNISQIVVSGHSNGGYAAARAGLFDNTPLGTGGLIKAVGSLWTVSDMNETYQELVGWGDPVNDPSYSWLVPMFMGVPNQAVTEEDLLRRSIYDYANITTPPNWFVISGSSDQMSSDEIQYSAMASAVKGQATAEELQTTCESYFATGNYGWWNNTDDPEVSITNGTARKIGMRKGLDHLGEAIDSKCVQEIVDWFVYSLDLEPSEHITRMEQGVAVEAIWIARFFGWILIIVAMVILQIVLAIYLAPIMFPERKRKYTPIKEEEDLDNKADHQYAGFLPPGLQEYVVDVIESTPRNLFVRFANTWKRKAWYFFGLTLCLSAGVAGFFIFRPLAFTRIWIFNAYLWQFLISSIFVWIYALVVLRNYKKSKYYGPYVSLERVGGTFKGLGKGFLYSFIVVFLPLTIYNILALLLVMPKFFPRPAETGIWGDVLFGMFIIWTLYLPFEVMIKTQLFSIKRKYAKKSGYWIEILMNSLLVFFIWMIAYLIGALFMGSNLLSMVFLSGSTGGFIFVTVNSLMFLLNGVSAFITGLIYQRTRNVFACSFYPVFLWGMIIFFKFMGIYSIMP